MKNRIRVRRAELDMSQEDLSKKAKLSRVTVANIERDKQTPNGDTMLRIAEALETTTSELFFLLKV